MLKLTLGMYTNVNDNAKDEDDTEMLSLGMINRGDIQALVIWITLAEEE